MRTLLLSGLHSNHETAGEVIFRRVDYPVDRARKRIRDFRGFWRGGCSGGSEPGPAASAVDPGVRRSARPPAAGKQGHEKPA